MFTPVPPHPVADKVAALILRLAHEAERGTRVHTETVACVRISGRLFLCKTAGTVNGRPACEKAVFEWSAFEPGRLVLDPSTERRCVAPGGGPSS
jgi:hypothetical protein